MHTSTHAHRPRPYIHAHEDTFQIYTIYRNAEPSEQVSDRKQDIAPATNKNMQIYVHTILNEISARVK